MKLRHKEFCIQLETIRGRGMLILTLTQLAVVKVATSLYEAPEFLDVQKKYNSHLYDLPVRKWEHLVKEKLPPSSCSTAVLNKIIAVLRPISYEAWNWVMDHRTILSWEDRKKFDIPFSWKLDGTIDRIKTADRIIQSQDFMTEIRLTMACQYWHWYEIEDIWISLSANEQCIFLEEYMKESMTERHNCMIYRFLEFRNINYVPYSQLWSFKFEWNNVTMFNRVFDRLPPAKQVALEDDAVRKTAHIPLGRHCLSRMNAQRRMRALQQFPYRVLRIYLFWPLQALFTDAASTVHDVLSSHSFLCLIHILICQKILTAWKDWEYVDLLTRFWHEEPGSF
ncbi:uncharacterized protein TNIN_69931 [Trichonephila inaurata madagascariensis]|uniref:Uncharacterized protein n=1 Tax=Trichonephila inaurata madagascariensis TaxID=2747483 RepID=A0A8X6XQA6_9ARAC|nr:uncharacterized protein TNIN_69931 [Trichonephila inaurata madagascariensis]